VSGRGSRQIRIGQVDAWIALPGSIHASTYGVQAHVRAHSR